MAQAPAGPAAAFGGTGGGTSRNGSRDGAAGPGTFVIKAGDDSSGHVLIRTVPIRDSRFPPVEPWDENCIVPGGQPRRKVMRELARIELGHVSGGSGCYTPPPPPPCYCPAPAPTGKGNNGFGN